MRPFRSVITLDEARHLLMSSVRPIVRVERLPLSDAAGRVAATDVISSLHVPPFARSIMDGYAVIAADTARASTTPVELTILERVYTGQMPQQRIVPGTCAEIATGAPLPQGADAVVMVEDTTSVAGERVAIRTVAKTGQHIAPRGSDISAGDLVVQEGALLNPARLGAVAAIGRTDVEAYARPRVATVSTGNEVVEPGTMLAGGHAYDVNRFTLGPLIAANGCIAEAHAPVADTLEAHLNALADCAGADVVVFSGSSVGERDLVTDLIALRGRMLFHGVALKPGKPTAFAIVDEVPFFGMPGNPTSCLSNAYLLLVPFLRATARLPPALINKVRARLGQRIVSPAGRHQVYTIRMENGIAVPAFKGSGEITSLSQADGFLEIAADQTVVEKDTIVEITLL